MHRNMRFVTRNNSRVHARNLGFITRGVQQFQRAQQHFARAPAHQVAHLRQAYGGQPFGHQHMVERSAKVGRGVEQRAVKIKSDDIERKIGVHARAIARAVWKLQGNAGKDARMTAQNSPLALVVLAAGKGTRMKSDTHKVLHPVAGRPMLDHLLASAAELAPAATVVVAGHGRDQLEKQLAGRATIALQEPQLGTGHAVAQAEQALAEFDGNVLILYGDVPFVSAQTMRAMLARLEAADAPAVVVLAFEPDDALQYGRVITVPAADGLIVRKMVEHKDATDAERACRVCNSGLMAVRAADLFGLLARVGNDNAQGEYYLTDIVNIANADGRICAAVVAADEFEVAGINSRGELAQAEARWQQRRREAAMVAGVTLVAPETVWFSWDTQLGRDVTVEPNVVFGPGVVVDDHVTIHAFSHLEGAHVASGAHVGPYARLRPGASIGKGARIGNFVEIKNATIGAGAKANHLSYVGDAEVGAGANLGAGTITCNYDGYFKYKTVIGERAFIGSNSALIAPVSVGADAIVAAGSAVSRDVAAGELRLVRAEQLIKPGWADRFHDAMKKKKAEKKG
jgi:bifunctional UDP-N-acetylglucosamine pyrophosphorylase/glucosamine-1-phosphate N-acetyltransferase